MEQAKKSLNLAKLINHQHKIIDKIQELAQVIEKMHIAKAELKALVNQSQSEILAEMEKPHQAQN